MECMDEDKSFWWKQSKWDKSISTFQQLRELHEGTYILGLESYNAEFCARLPALLSVEGGVEMLIFDFMETKISEEIRPKHLAYMRVRLNRFNLSKEEFEAILTNHSDYNKVSPMVPRLTWQIAEYTTKFTGQADTDISRIQAKTNDFVGTIAPLRWATVNPMDGAQ